MAEKEPVPSSSKDTTKTSSTIDANTTYSVPGTSSSKDTSGTTCLTADALYACLDVSEEDEKQYPEAIECLKKIIATLGPNGVTPSVKAKVDAQLEHHSKQHVKLRKGPMLIAAIKQVFRDQQMNGYDRLPEELVEEMTHKLYLTEMRDSLGDKMQNVACLENIFANITPVELTPEHKQIFIELICEKFAQIPLDFDEVKADIDYLKQKFAETLVLLQKKKIERQKLEKQREEMILKLTDLARDELKRQEADLEVYKLEREISILETRMQQNAVLQELYSGDKGEVIKRLLTENKEKVASKEANIKELEDQLRKYAALPQEEFQNIVKNYKSIQKEIENAEWSLEKLQSDDA